MNLWAIDIFAGMGVASLGFQRAGFKIKAAVEIDNLRCFNYENNVGIKPIQEDLRKISGAEIRSVARVKKGETDVLIGCPPCQAFSKLSETRGIDPMTDSRSMFVIEFARRVEEIRPKVVVFENVPGIMKEPARFFFNSYYEHLRTIGYETVFDIVNAKDYGVPQNRKRVLAISAIRGKFAIKLPLPHKFDKRIGANKKRYPERVRDAIGELRPLHAGEKDPKDSLHAAAAHNEKVMKIIKNIPKDGGSRTSLPRHLWLPCHKALGKGADSVYGRMWWDEPAPTITCKCITPSSGRFVHPDQDRGITLREAARLQTIPDNVILKGAKDNIAAMIGDAVPFNLANAIALHVVNSICP